MSDDLKSWGGMRREGLIADLPHVDRPGQARILKRVRFPDDGNGLIATDRRIHMHVDDLRKLIQVAEQSPLQRVVFHGAGVEIELREIGGHRFENWTILGVPVPEGVEAELQLQRKSGQVMGADELEHRRDLMRRGFGDADG